MFIIAPAYLLDLVLAARCRGIELLIVDQGRALIAESD